MKTKIIIAALLLFLIIGVASASQFDDLKAPNGYEDMAAGISEKLDNPNVYFYIGEMEYNKDIFENTTTNYTNQIVTPLEDNIYKFVDSELNTCGVQEKVKLDGKEYVVSIVEEESTDGDIDSYLTTLKDFNKLNNLEPLKV